MKNNKKLLYLLIVVFVVLTAVIRFVPLFSGNFPFLFDHGRDLLDVKKIVVDHHQTLIGPFTGIQGVFQGPYHYYLLAIPFVLSGGHPASGTFFMAVLGVLGVILCFFLGKRMIDVRFGIFAALFFAIAPASIAFSQHFWNPHWIPFLMILYYFFLFKSIFEKEAYLLPLFFVASLMAQLEVADGIWMLPATLIVILLYKRKYVLHKYFWIAVVIYGSLFLPQVLFDLRHQFLMTQSIITFLTGKNQSLGLTIPFDSRIFIRINELQQATIFALSRSALLGYFFALAGAGYFAYTIIKKQKKEIKIISLFLVAPLVYFIAFLLFSRPAWSWYWIGLQTSYYFFIAFVLSRMITFKKIYTYMIFAFVIIWSITTIASYKTFPIKDDVGVGIFKNEMRVIDAIYKDANKQQFGVFVYTPPVYDYAYQYLFWWRAKNYGYAPTTDKNGIFYLIIEPDGERPLAPKGWKETVIKTGKVLWSKTFQGGIVVEKRQGN